nr:radical SAM protein [Candidatus Aenigmarchaeota archaeon]
MKVLLYQTEMNPGNMKGVYYFGPGAIAAYLKEKGHDVHFRTVNNTALDKEDFLSEIQRIDPGLIGFSVMTDEWFYVAKLVAWIKEKFDIPIICGGAHPTMAPEKVIANENVDMLCRGEGEYPLEELCACLDEGRDYRQIQNLWVKDGEKVFSNPLRPLIENLDDLPFPDTEMLDFQKILRENDYIARFMVRRGCPFECTYCINQGIHKLYRGKGKLVRRRSPERVIEGLKAIADKYSEIQGIGFDDDIFALDKNWLRRFCRLYSEEIGLPFSCYMRIERIDREFLEIVKNAGCTWLDIGLESGNEWLRRTILNRKMSNAEIIQKFGVIDAFEIETTSLNMVGPPYETVEMLEETIELNRRIKPTCLIAGPFQPYPGTKLGELCIERGWFSDDGMEFVDRSVSVLNLPALTRAEISYYAHRLNHAGHAIRAKKAPVGAYDFLSHLEEADIEQSSEG